MLRKEKLIFVIKEGKKREKSEKKWKKGKKGKKEKKGKKREKGKENGRRKSNCLWKTLIIYQGGKNSTHSFKVGKRIYVPVSFNLLNELNERID